jgi:hypothetical protein
MRTLLIDNSDSFTFNLVHLPGEVNGDEPIVARNDELSWEELAALSVDNIVISPDRPSHRTPAAPDRERAAPLSVRTAARNGFAVRGVARAYDPDRVGRRRLPNSRVRCVVGITRRGSRHRSRGGAP